MWMDGEATANYNDDDSGGGGYANMYSLVFFQFKSHCLDLFRFVG